MAIKIQGMSLTQKHEINALKIIAVKEVVYAFAKRKPDKISGLLGFEPSPVRYRCSAPKKWNYVVYRKIPKISPSKYKPPKPVTQKTLR